MQRFATLGAQRDWRRGVLCGCAIAVVSPLGGQTVPVLLVGVAMVAYFATLERKAGVYVTDLGIRLGPERWRRTVPWSDVERFELLDGRSSPVVLRRRDRRPLTVSVGDWWWCIGRRRRLEHDSAVQMVADLNALVGQHRVAQAGA